jgi:hypothetical protein
MLLLLFFLLPLTIVAHSSQYNVIQRSSHRYLAEDEMEVPSFDGDIQAILDLALAKAADPPSLSPSMAPTQLPFMMMNAHTCPQETTQSLFILTYTYSLETVSNVLPSQTSGEGEEILQELLAPQVLTCMSGEAKPAKIVALDSLPRDKEATDVICEPELDASNVCTVWTGKMRFFVSAGAKESITSDLVFEKLPATMESKVFLRSVGTGLVKATFLEQGEGPSGIRGDPDLSTPSASGMGLSAIVLVSIGSAAFIVLAGSVFYWSRQTGNHSGLSYEGSTTNLGSTGASATLMSYQVNMSNNDASAETPSSPFSEMLPDAYRFTDNMSITGGPGPASLGNMIPIDEEQDDMSHASSSQVLMLSENGYSTDAEGATDSSVSMDLPRSLYQRRAPNTPPKLLGAFRFQNVETLSDQEFSSDQDSVDMGPNAAIETTLLDTELGLHDYTGPDQDVNTSNQSGDVLLFYN